MKWFVAVLLLPLLSCHSPRKSERSSHAFQSPVPDSLYRSLGPLPEYSVRKMKYNFFDWQGHRGCRGLMPENTIPAMYKAIDLDVVTLEMDVVITKDSMVLVSHDNWMGSEITTKPDGTYITETEEKNYNIYRMDYAETQRYDVGMKPHPRFPNQQKMKVTKPLLANLIDSVKAYCKQKNKPLPHFNIETKCLPSGDDVFHPGPERFVELLMQVIAAKGIEQNTIIQSFDFRTLQYQHRQYPKMKTAMLVEDTDKRTPEQLLHDLGFTPTIYSPHYSLLNTDVIRFFHDKRILVIPWTVNEKEKIIELKKMGVDGLISDYPDLFNGV